MTDREDDEAFDALRVPCRKEPGHGRAPVVADDVRPLDPERVEQRLHVAEDEREPVVPDVRRPVGGAEAAEIGRDRTEPRPGERRDLTAPEVRGVREPVQEEHGRPRPLVDDVEAEPVRLDEPAARAGVSD